jgi:hypothetical protein
LKGQNAGEEYSASTDLATSRGYSFRYRRFFLVIRHERGTEPHPYHSHEIILIRRDVIAFPFFSD